MTDDEHPVVVVVVELLEGVRPCVGGVVEGFVCDRSVHLTNIVSTINQHVSTFNQHCHYNYISIVSTINQQRSVPLTCVGCRRVTEGDHHHSQRVAVHSQAAGNKC